jgi:hypothetical protein
MLQAFVFEQVAVLVQPWYEPMNPPERGARVELRMIAHEPQRGSRSAAQRVVIDQPVFRADLFDQVDAPPGNLRSAHFHPRFEGVEPCDRYWDDAIQRDPLGWLADQLGDLPRLLRASGRDAARIAAIDDDVAALRRAVPAVTAAVEAAWDTVRTATTVAR